MNLKVGIDPTGGANPFSPDVVWSVPGDVYDEYAPFSVDAVAEAGQVTVFTYSRPVYPLQHNDVYLDDASLVVIGSAAREATREFIATSSGTPPPGGRTPRPTSLPYGTAVDYEVKPGDTLAVIAWRHGVTVADIVFLNQLKSNVLSPGQVLKVGIAPTATPTPTPTDTPTVTLTPTATSYLWATPTPLPDGRAVYYVQAGDTLRVIAWHFQITPQAIVELNELKSSMLSVGQELVLAKDLPTTTPAPTPSLTPTPSLVPTRVPGPHRPGPVIFPPLRRR